MFVIMPTVPRSYTLAVLEEPRSKPNLHRKSPVSRSKLVSTVLGLIIHQNKVSPAAAPSPAGLRSHRDDADFKTGQNIQPRTRNLLPSGAAPPVGSTDLAEVS